VWRRSSVAVFRPVGNPNSVLVSPPQVSTTLPIEKMMVPEMCYYNLHGLADTAEWYGQRDPGDPANGPDYPIALTPKELRRNGHAPKVVFSEACYGGFVMNKAEDEAVEILVLGDAGGRRFDLYRVWCDQYAFSGGRFAGQLLLAGSEGRAHGR
jgi:hypothetical protein